MWNQKKQKPGTSQVYRKKTACRNPSTFDTQNIYTCTWLCHLFNIHCTMKHCHLYIHHVSIKLNILSLAVISLLKTCIHANTCIKVLNRLFCFGANHFFTFWIIFLLIQNSNLKVLHVDQIKNAAAKSILAIKNKCRSSSLQTYEPPDQENK